MHAAIYPLKHVAPVVSLSVVYLPAVLVVSIDLGRVARLRHRGPERGGVQLLPPAAGRPVHDPDSDNWVALVAFLVVAALASSVAEVTRARTRDAEERRREADLAAEMARLLLRGNNLARRCRRPLRAWRRRSS